MFRGFSFSIAIWGKILMAKIVDDVVLGSVWMLIGRSFYSRLISVRQFCKPTRLRPGYCKGRITPKIMKIDSQEFKDLFTPQLNHLADLFKKNNYEIRIAGGAVRDLLMGKVPSDVDFASTATPTEMKALFERESIRMLHKRGEEHGTITCRLDDKENFEITTLRVDVVCDGRRAEVEYTRDWQLDANRRDLTINSLFLDLDGNVVDYFDGIKDIENRRVAFVGEAEQRIQEDYLRILRYFRFFGRIAASDVHEESTLEAIRKNCDGLKGISAERIWTEMKKIVIGRMAPQVLRSMLDSCRLGSYLGLPANYNLERLEKVFDRFGIRLEPMTAIACLCEKMEDIAQFHKITKLSNAERLLGEYVVSRRDEAEQRIDDVTWWKRAVVDLEVICKNDKLKTLTRESVIQLGMGVCLSDELLDIIKQWTLPVFPVNGVMLMNAGVKNGPMMRNTLQYLGDMWIKSDYGMTREDLLSHALDAEIPEPPSQKIQKRKRQDSK